LLIMTTHEPAPSPAIHRIAFRPYRVSGATLAELRACIALLGPRHAGASFGGLTTWTVGWAFTPIVVGDRAVAREVEVVLDVEVRLPEWQAPRSAHAATCGRFRAWLLALARHEAGHVAVAAEAADAVAALIAAAEGPGPAALRRTIDERARTTIAGARRAERRYDDETDHGRTQGAAWIDGCDLGESPVFRCA
jgi:predicted secreted Zn-dependent protease